MTDTLNHMITASKEPLSKLDELRAERDRLEDQADALEKTADRLNRQAKAKRAEADRLDTEYLNLLVPPTGRLQ